MHIQPKLKANRHKEVILLVDNRKDNEPVQKSNHVDFYNSAFKSTDIDPLEGCSDISYLSEEDDMLQLLKQKISKLEKRVESLEKQSNQDLGSSKSGEGEKKKARRRFNELNRNIKCPHAECAKNYASETSLKSHLKLKHIQPKAQN